jgi:FkbM family methyltransferase
MTRGKGLIFRMVRGILPTAHTIFEIEPGVFVEANIDDYLGRDYFLHGANVGYWVLGAAARLGAAGHAHSFEPSPELFQALEGNVRLNRMQQITCHRLAVTDRMGDVSFRPSPENTGRGALSASSGEPTSIVVTGTTIDSFCREQGLARIDFLKVDVEGAEENVFRGATSILSGAKSPIVLFEIGGGQAEKYGSSAVRSKALLADFGYVPYRLHGGRLRRVEADETHRVTEDLFALKRQHIIERPALADCMSGESTAGSPS